MTASNDTSGDILVHIQSLAQLFNSFDPSPFHERDLDDDAESYIIGWARELPEPAPIRLIIDLPEEEARKAEERGLAMALTNYFSERASSIERDIRELFRVGWRILAISVPILVVCLVASQSVEALLSPGPVARVMEESLLLLGWVANWKPIEIFLFDWLPLRRRRNLYRRLAAAEVRIRTRSK